MEHPFVPKSTVNLRFGDYWAIRREDSQFGFLVYLKSIGPGRVIFTAAVLDHVQSNQILEPQGFCFNFHRFGVINRIGRLHIKTFRETNSEFLGNIAERLPMAEIEKAYELQKSTVSVWGYRTPIKLVNEIKAPQRWLNTVKSSYS